MRRRHCTYLMLLVVLAGLAGCLPDKKKQQAAKWNVSLEKNSKQPYGTYLAWQSLKYYFPGAEIEALSRGFKYSNMDDKMKYNNEGRSLIILEGLYFHLTDWEWKELKQFIENGNEVIVFSSWLDERIEHELNCNKEGSGDENNKYYLSKEDFENKGVLTLAEDPHYTYGHEGRYLKGYFSFKTDSEFLAGLPASTATDNNGDPDTTQRETAPQRDTLGYALSRPNMIRYAIGEGHLTLHAAPLTLTNYFLLQDGNEKYLTGIWRTLPPNINRVYWNDFYYRDTEASSLDILWRYPATSKALTLAIIALIIYVLFEGKRKQRIIPIIAPLKNESVSFVETVGRLYYNKGNHTNLAGKMIQQFLEWVRSNYFLNTNQLNEAFIHQLTIKSGQPEATVRELMEMIHEIKLGTVKTDDAYLYQLYNTIQQFYKNKRR